jgi:hypothetical protein
VWKSRLSKRHAYDANYTVFYEYTL